ncbi:helix-turn-helix domain-containing protein [Streptomyces sp. CT34]|uniref:helix-turn-helix domain-containing protein n=1 Tax=Streptomyces sp. CT34 TaxID=1553907 RepID=UPI0005BC4E49|nr:helix-turn-helix domain-containing protein [Streptomyces sp. CT34]
MTDLSAQPSLAERIDALFRSGRPDGRPWTNDEVAAQIKTHHPKVKVSGAYLSALRTGKRSRPSIELLTGLAEFFGVPVSRLTDTQAPTTLEHEIAALPQLNQAGMRSIMLRAVGVNDDGLKAVAAVLDHVRQLQGLPPVSGDQEAE